MCTRIIFYQFPVYVNVELYVVLSEKKCFTEYDHGYVYTTKHRYVIGRYYFLCETLVSKSDTRRVEQ